jgi:hypothetical protein
VLAVVAVLVLDVLLIVEVELAELDLLVAMAVTVVIQDHQVAPLVAQVVEQQVYS